MQPFVTKLGIVVHHHEPECHAKTWDSIFKVKFTVWEREREGGWGGEEARHSMGGGEMERKRDIAGEGGGMERKRDIAWDGGGGRWRGSET